MISSRRSIQRLHFVASWCICTRYRLQFSHSEVTQQIKLHSASDFEIQSNYRNPTMSDLLVTPAATFDCEAAMAPIAARGGERLMDLTFLQAISLEKPSKKRALELDVVLDDDLDVDIDWAVDTESVTSSDGSDARVSSPSSLGERQTKAPAVKKQRKPTHVVRKVRLRLGYALVTLRGCRLTRWYAA